MIVITSLGCAPQLGNMVPDQKNLIFESTGKTASVTNVNEGGESSGLENASINGKDYRSALIEALANSKLFTRIAVDTVADYEIAPRILAQDQPDVGLDLSVNFFVHYVVTKSQTKEKMYEKTVKSHYTASLLSCCIAAVRLQKANEGAVRENIKLFLQDISILQFN
jgi:hypothetical protein